MAEKMTPKQTRKTARKKLGKRATIAKDLETAAAIRSAKGALRELTREDFRDAETVITKIRVAFPMVDDYLTPFEIIEAAGLDLGKLAACPSCLSCFTCQNCNSCQTCNYCQKCESCNTCQKEIGVGSITTVINPDDVIRNQLVALVQRFSTFV